MERVEADYTQTFRDLRYLGAISVSDPFFLTDPDPRGKIFFEFFNVWDDIKER